MAAFEFLYENPNVDVRKLEKIVDSYYVFTEEKWDFTHKNFNSEAKNGSSEKNAYDKQIIEYSLSLIHI